MVVLVLIKILQKYSILRTTKQSAVLYLSYQKGDSTQRKVVTIYVVGDPIQRQILPGVIVSNGTRMVPGQNPTTSNKKDMAIAPGSLLLGPISLVEPTVRKRQK